MLQLVRCIQLLRVRCMLQLLRCIQLLRRIIAKADVLIQNLSPGAGTTHSRTQMQTKTHTHTHARTHTHAHTHTQLGAYRFNPRLRTACLPCAAARAGFSAYPAARAGFSAYPVQRRVRAFAPRRCIANTRGSSRWTSQGDRPPRRALAPNALRRNAKACVGRAVCESQPRFASAASGAPRTAQWRAANRTDGRQWHALQLRLR